MTIKKLFRLPRFTVGIKILIGVSLASNLFIGLLVYTNQQSTKTITCKVNEVLTIREQLSSNLRTAIVSLQKDFLSLPGFFKANPRENILKAIDQGFTISEKRHYQSRDTYKGLFKRKERRDIAQHKFIIQQEDNALFISWGIFDGENSFKGEVDRIQINSNSPKQDLAKLHSIVARFTSEGSQATALKTKVSELNGKVADAGLKAEQTRNEILEYVEEIENLEKELSAIRAQQRQRTLLSAGIAILANMLVLFILVRWIVEKPLHRLTDTINAIRSGEETNIPYSKRKDQIGALSGTIANFREALSQIKNENYRRQEEKGLVEEMVDTSSTIINSLEKRANELVTTAVSLEKLAAATKTQSDNVTHQANVTADHTSNVSQSTTKLQEAFYAINTQMHGQNQVLDELLSRNVKSESYIKDLNDSVKDIHSIINTVSDITGQTKLLALNATIEAARAGSAGKGFAVVANEVKDLSYKTEQATKDVMNRVEAIEKAVAILVTNLASINQGIEELNQTATTISSAVDTQQEETDHISHLASQTSSNTQSVSTSIIEVSEAATQTRDLAAQVHVFSNQIAGQLSNLLQSTTAQLGQLTKE